MKQQELSEEDIMTNDTVEQILENTYKAMSEGQTIESVGVGLAAISPVPLNTSYLAGNGKKGFIPQVIAQILSEHMEDKRVFKEYAALYSTSLVGNGKGNTLTLTRLPYYNYDLQVGGVYVNRWAPVSVDATGTAPGNTDSYTALEKTATLTYEEFDVKPVEHRLATDVTKQMVEDANFDVINVNFAQLADKFAAYEDEMCVAALIKPGTQTASVVTNTDIGVKYITHDGTGYKRGYWNTADITAGTTVTAEGKLDVRLIIQAKQIDLGKYNYNGDVLFVEPEQYADLISSVDNQFLFASAYSNNRPLTTGEVGTIVGVKVVQSNAIAKVYTQTGFIAPLVTAASGSDPAVTGHQAILVDSSKAYAIVVKRPLTIESEYSAKNRLYSIYATTRFATTRLENGATVLINTA